MEFPVCHAEFSGRSFSLQFPHSSFTFLWYLPPWWIAEANLRNYFAVEVIWTQAWFIATILRMCPDLLIYLQTTVDTSSPINNALARSLLIKPWRYENESRYGVERTWMQRWTMHARWWKFQSSLDWKSHRTRDHPAKAWFWFFFFHVEESLIFAFGEQNFPSRIWENGKLDVHLHFEPI